jgi:hypothetical protein
MLHKSFTHLRGSFAAAKAFIAFVASCFVWAGCGGGAEEEQASVESRMSSTAFLALMQANRVKSKHDRLVLKYKAIADWLDAATPEEIAEPSHIIAYAEQRDRAGGSPWTIYVRWVSLRPYANGILLTADGGVAPLAFAMCAEDVTDNEAATEHYILYAAEVTQQDDPGPWSEFDSLARSRTLRLLLTRDGDAVSEPCELLILETESPTGLPPDS